MQVRILICLHKGHPGAPQGTSALERSDTEIVREVLAGDRESFGLLFSRYRLLVVNFVTARVGRRAEAELITQDAFVRAYRSLATLTSPDRFSSWLLRIAGNLCHDWLREQARAPTSLDHLSEEVETGAQAAPSHDSPVQAAQRRELGTRIGVAIANLDEPYRTTASLRYLAGKSCAEIAQIQDLEIGAVTMRLSRANRKLRLQLSDLAPDSDPPDREGPPAAGTPQDPEPGVN